VIKHKKKKFGVQGKKRRKRTAKGGALAKTKDPNVKKQFRGVKFGGLPPKIVFVATKKMRGRGRKNKKR